MIKTVKTITLGFFVRLLLWHMIAVTLYIYIVHPANVYARTNKVDLTKYKIALFKEAILNFKKHTGRFPTSTEGLKALLVKPENNSTWHGPYLNYHFIPLDLWGSNYLYMFPSRYLDEEYDLYSIGPNKIDEHGQGDDINLQRDKMR